MSTQTFPSSVPKEDDFEVVDGEDFEVLDKNKLGEPDPFNWARERRRIKTDLSKLRRTAPAAVPIKEELAKLDTAIKEAGYDPDELEKEFWDMPTITGFTSKEALALKAENPLLFERKKAAIKSQYALSHAVTTKLGASGANDFMKSFYQKQKAGDYASQREATKEAMSAVHTYVDDEDEQRKIKADLIRDKSFGYGVGLPGQDEALMSDPRAENMNPYQLTAIQFLEDVDPPTAEAFNRLLAFTPEEVDAQKGNVSFMRGWEKKSRDLENIGMNLQRKALEEKMTAMLKTKDRWTEDQKGDYIKSLQAYETLAADMQNQQDRYPAMATLDADALMQEAMGPTKGLAEQTVLGIGENVDDAVNWLGDLVKAPFLSDKEEAGEDLELMGDKERTRLDQYETAGQQLFTPETLVKFKGDLERKVNKIKGDESLTEEEKRDQVKTAVLEDRRKNVEWIANDAGGKMNLTGKSFMGAVSNIVSEIAPQLAIAYLSGGAASGSKVKQLSSLFGSTFAIAYRDNYNSALEQNIAKPSQYALSHTIIEAASELMHNDVAMARNLFKGKAAARALGSITRQEMSAIGRAGAGRWAKFGLALGQAAKGSTISAYKEGAEELVGRFGMNVTDKAAFNQDIAMGEGLVEDFVTTFVGMLPLGILGLPAQYKKINRVQQYALYEAGMNPEKFNAKVDEDLAAGVISEGDANKRKKAIARAAATIQEMETIRPDGTELTDNERSKFLLNQMALEDIKSQQKNASPELKMELEAQQELIENEQKKILETKPVEPARAEIEQNRKEELAKAKTEYAEYDADFREEQMDIINEKYDEQLKELEKREEELEKEEKKVEEIESPAQQIQPDDQKVQTPAEIETEEALEQELTRAMTPRERTEQIEPAAGVENISDPQTKVSTEQLGITEQDDISSVVDKLISQQGGFTPMLKMMKNLPALKDVKFNMAVPGKNPLLDKWLQSRQVDMDKVAGFYIPKSRVIGTDYEKLGGTLVINPKQSSNPYYDITHELGHALTLDGVSKWRKIMNQSDQQFVEDIYNYIKSKKPDANIENINEYGLKSMEEFLVEAVINPEFRSYVSDVWASSRQEFLDEARKGQPRDFIKVLMEFFQGLIRQAFGKGPYAEGVETRPLIDQAVETMSRLYFKENQQAVPMALPSSKKSPKLKQAPEGTEGQFMASRQINTQEDAVKDIIRRTSKSISDARLLQILEKSTGLPAPVLQSWIDEIRALPPTPPAPKPSVALSERQRQMALNKFDRLFRKEWPKKKPWYSRAWDSLRNLSSLLDNPYRFVTKVTEDINRHYKIKGTEVIPLGRVFEKSAAGKAALAVDRFVQAVVYGRIGGQKLGQIKGKKFDDFQKYVAAKRVIDRIDTQEQLRAQGEDVSRQTGNITRQDAEVFLEELSRLKPELVKDFETRAKAFQEHMDTMLQELVAAGNISKEAYTKIKKENDFYAPFSVVRQQFLADMKGEPVGIAGVVKRIKGIGYDLQSVPSTSPLAMMNDLADALNRGQISAEEYFNSALDLLDNALAAGQIDQQEYDLRVTDLENPGFEINGMIDAAANMIYRAQGMALKNTMMQRLYAYKEKDTEGLFIQDVDGMTPMQIGGDTVMVPKPLNTIPVPEGMAPVRLRFQGKDKVVAVNKYAADKLNGMNNFEMPAIMVFSDWLNRVFRALVITLSPGFQAVNFAIDFVRASMLSRYGALAGKGMIQPLVNAILFIPQYIEALGHSALGNIGLKTDTYKQWMESDSFSRGMYDNLFDNEKRFKAITASRAKNILNNFLKLKFIEVPGAILEQTHKLAIYERGMAVEGMKPEMFTAMLGSLFNQHVSANMTQQQLTDAIDRLNYEVQNYAGSPNFPQTAPWLKIASLFLQFFSARVKGEMTDYRRVANLFAGTGEGVKLSTQNRAQMIIQFGSVAGAIAFYALMNNSDDEDEAEFNSIPAYHQDNYLNIPAGTFEYKDAEGETTTRRDYLKMPLRGLTASMNVIANKYVKWKKHQDPASLKEMALGILGNSSPMNLHGKDEHELGESAVSNMTPVFKYFMEYSFNRDTHAHRDIIPDTHGKRSMLSRYRAGDIEPWLVRNPKTPAWCSELSRFLKEELDWTVSAATIEHMEKTMGNPSELYNNAIQKRLIRSEMKYPVAGSTPFDEAEKQREIEEEIYKE